jgi:hypothetical protein
MLMKTDFAWAFKLHGFPHCLLPGIWEENDLQDRAETVGDMGLDHWVRELGSLSGLSQGGKYLHLISLSMGNTSGNKSVSMHTASKGLG